VFYAVPIVYVRNLGDGLQNTQPVKSVYRTFNKSEIWPEDGILCNPIEIREMNWIRRGDLRTAVQEGQDQRGTEEKEEAAKQETNREPDHACGSTHHSKVSPCSTQVTKVLLQCENTNWMKGTGLNGLTSTGLQRGLDPLQALLERSRRSLMKRPHQGGQTLRSSQGQPF
jgi:hypothetical protein